jgi:hypothetical protein
MRRRRGNSQSVITTFDVLRIVLNSFADEILTMGDMIVRFLDKDDDEAD